ncbi:alpha,alpha-trehalase, partial [Ostertagia ostertagi]
PKRTESHHFRPESYREDASAAANITDPDAKLQFYQDIASGAESGWDFSIRWFADKVSLNSIETTNVVPVDLNAFICYNLHILGALHAEVGNEHKSSSWTAQYIKFRGDFEKIFYVKEAKGWYDYNLRTKQHNTDFYASIAVPLFTQCYEPLSLSKSDDLYDKMEEMGVFSYVGGIPTRMQQKSFLLAEKWILSNLHVFESDQVMWEKYDVVSASPRLGGGGEYLV